MMLFHSIPIIVCYCNIPIICLNAFLDTHESWCFPRQAKMVISNLGLHLCRPGGLFGEKLSAGKKNIKNIGCRFYGLW